MLKFIFKYVAIGLFFATLYLVITQYLINREPSSLLSPSASHEASSYSAAINRARPAVVRIRVTERKKRSLLGRQYRNQSSLESGSGVIFNPEGYILTSDHIVNEAVTILVFLLDGQAYEARLVGRDIETDLAVLKIDGDNLPYIPVNRDRELKVGDIAFAIGNPFGSAQTSTMGIISATNQYFLDLSFQDTFIQTDAAINLGNSGGALINAHGELTGLITAVGFSRKLPVEGFGIAIPLRILDSVYRQIIEHGRVIRGWIGIYPAGFVATNTCQSRKNQALYARVRQVTTKSPASKAGIRMGDVIAKINNEIIRDAGHLARRITNAQPGTSVELQILRPVGNYQNCQTHTIQVEIAEKPINPQLFIR